LEDEALGALRFRGVMSSSPSPLSSAPMGVSLTGRIGTTVVPGGVDGVGLVVPVGAEVRGPLEGALDASHDVFLSGLGCASPSDAYTVGGVDTRTLEAVVAARCGIQVPRWVPSGGRAWGTRIGVLDACGGHSTPYHVHQVLDGCWESGGEKGHSGMLALMEDGRGLYGRWEDAEEEPRLDVCGGHFGYVPSPPPAASEGAVVKVEGTGRLEWTYHYHVRSTPPFTAACFGPASGERPVRVSECRALYPEHCDDGDVVTLLVAYNATHNATHNATRGAASDENEKGPVGPYGPGVEVEYDPWCPCFDAAGSNVGGPNIVEWPIARPHAASSAGLTRARDGTVAWWALAAWAASWVFA